MLHHSGSPRSSPMRRSLSMPALQTYIIEPIWEQLCALLPERDVDHPLGCHRSRIPDRVIFEKLVQVLVFGCAYWRISDEGCSATTLRRRRDEWIELGAMDALEKIVREAYDRLVGLELGEVAVDCCITKAPCGGEKAGRSPVPSPTRSSSWVGSSGRPGPATDGTADPSADHDLLAQPLRQKEMCHLRDAPLSPRA